MSKMKELQDAMIAAMKAKDKFRKDAISVLVSAAKKSGMQDAVRISRMTWSIQPS